MHLATQTLAAIDDVILADKGGRYRQLLRECMPTAEDAYRAEESDFRGHLGASILGRECAREVWYSFRWTTARRFGSRMLRLFNRGHLEEPRMVALLKMIGCTVYQFDANGKQFRVTGYKGHYGGGMDGVIVGCPDIPNEPILGEFKTYNENRFTKLAGKLMPNPDPDNPLVKKVRVDGAGVMTAHWEHFIQCQLYMGHWGLRCALYMATNKNTDELHAEIIQFDPRQYERYHGRAATVIDSRTPPPRISNTPGFWKCKFCDHLPVCHLNEPPARNCRTCKHSTPVEAGRWMCDNRERQLSLLFPLSNPEQEDFFLTEARQLRGCDYYEMNPSIKA